MSAAPESFSRRSFVHRELSALGASFAEVAGAAVAMEFGDPDGEAAAAKGLGLCDLSTLPRSGVKGWGALDWLRGQGMAIGADDNLAYPQGDGALVARLAASEALILATLDGGGPFAALDAAFTMETGVGAYPVPRAGANAWFLVSGGKAPALFAKLCGVDLRPGPFPNHAVAQTSIARLNGIIIRDDLGAGLDAGLSSLAYHLLADSASAAYLWAAVVDAMAEFEGRPVGLEAARRLAG
jgi:sarcosine oxidase subunit gamma